MPYTKSGLWVPYDIPTSGSQPRPHWWTFVIPVVATLVTLIGVIVGVVTLRQGDENFKIANRAYLSISSFAISTEANPSLHLTVSNAGNTPSLAIEVFYAIFDPRSTNDKNTQLIRIGNPEYIEPKGKTELGGKFHDLPKKHIIIGIAVMYEDVFNHRSAVGRCISMTNEIADGQPCLQFHLTQRMVNVFGLSPSSGGV